MNKIIMSGKDMLGSAMKNLMSGKKSAVAKGKQVGKKVVAKVGKKVAVVNKKKLEEKSLQQ